MGDDASTDAVEDPEDVDLPAWLDERAAEADIPREDLIDAAVAAYHAADGDGTAPRRIEERVETVESTVETLRGDVDEKIDDVRDRVLQVRDLAKGHTNDPEAIDDLDTRLEELRDRQTELAADLETVSADIDRIDEGFQNYETVLENLTETTRRLEARIDTLARVMRTTRDSVERVAGEQSERTQIESLAEAANRAGVRTARCQSCSASLDIALLTRPACPECGTTFADVEPATGFFGSATLTTGSPPALAPAEEDRTDPIEEMEADPTTDQ